MRPSPGWTSRHRLHHGSAQVRQPPWGLHDLGVAYHGFMSAPAWGLAGRSGGAAEAAAGPGSEAEQELMRYIGEAERTASIEVGGGTLYERPLTEGVTPEMEARGETMTDPSSSPLDYRKYRVAGQVEEPPKGGGGCGRCCKWVFRLLGVGSTGRGGCGWLQPGLAGCRTVSGELPDYPATRAAACAA